jgi:microcystin degradation protein MlrC
MGIYMDELRLVVVKSSQHFYHAFSPIASQIIYCDTPGSLSGDLGNLAFNRLPRPIWPLDEIRLGEAEAALEVCDS